MVILPQNEVEITITITTRHLQKPKDQIITDQLITRLIKSFIKFFYIMNEEKFVYHKDWEDVIIINKNHIHRKSQPHQISTQYSLNFHYLKILWPEWGTDIFYSIDNYHYYHRCDKNNYFFIEHYSYFFTKTEKENVLYFANMKDKICYHHNNPDLTFHFQYQPPYFILCDNQENEQTYFFFFQNKYIEHSYFSKNYQILQILYHSKKKTIFLTKDIFFFEEDLTISGPFIYHNKYLLLHFPTETIAFQKTNHIFKPCVFSNHISMIKDLPIYKKKYTLLFDGLFNLPLINYCKNKIVVDHIDNSSKNIIYQDLTIYYYQDKKELTSILEHPSLQELKFITSNSIHEIKKSNNSDLYFHLLNQHISKKINKHNSITPTLFFKNSKIPKIFHFIWLGNQQYPDEYLFYCKNWILRYPNVYFCFWTDHNLFPLTNQQLFDQADTFAQKADIARYEILYQYGGVYIDADVFNLKNIDTLFENGCLHGFSGYESELFIAIGFMGFKQFDPFLEKVIRHLPCNTIIFNDDSIPSQSGPVYFTTMWKKYVLDDPSYKAFPISYFYHYTFQDKEDKKEIFFKNDNYCYHSWGNSWSCNKTSKKIYDHLSCLKEYLKMEDSSLLCVPQKSNKKKIIHIMGYFFVGGIEKYLHYIDLYGNHDEFEYIVVSYQKQNLVPEKFQNMSHYFFKNHSHLNSLLLWIHPDCIIDHYSTYIDLFLYENHIFHSIIFHFIHSAIHYDKDISNVKIRRCIHLYKEESKHPSWLQISHHYFTSLGVEIPSIKNSKKKKRNKIHVGIVGRICEEKIPITFFKRLCELSIQCKNSIQIMIFGKKSDIGEYNHAFHECIDKSNIQLMGFIPTQDIYHQIDVLVIPSVYETGSFVCLEAFSFGIPVICRNNYGLRKIVKDSIYGYLCDSDCMILEKIKYINFDEILDKKDIIREYAEQFQIHEKIKEVESIWLRQINFSKNVVIVTSVMNIIKKSLSYYPIRSKFSVHDRFSQTKLTIQSIRKKIPSAVIVFCECSHLEYYEYENEIKKLVDHYLNFYDNVSIRNAVQSEHKGYGEAMIMREALSYIKEFKAQHIFKISARYVLEDDFHFEDFHLRMNCFTLWDKCYHSFCTLFYKIHHHYIDSFYKCIDDHLSDLQKGKCLEMIIGLHFPKYCTFHNIRIMEKVHVGGNLSTEGYYFSI